MGDGTTVTQQDFILLNEAQIREWVEEVEHQFVEEYCSKCPVWNKDKYSFDGKTVITGCPVGKDHDDGQTYPCDLKVVEESDGVKPG